MNDNIENKFPFAPGLSLEQAQECADKIAKQYSKQIAEAKYLESKLRNG